MRSSRMAALLVVLSILCFAPSVEAQINKEHVKNAPKEERVPMPHIDPDNPDVIKLREDPKNPRLIKTIYGAGYIFLGDVKWS